MFKASIIIILIALQVNSERSFLKKAILSGDCPKCQAGYYSNTTGATQCTPCEVGTQTEVGGSEKCKKCPEGKFMANKAAIVCDKCKKGTYSDIKGLSKCTPCESGTQQDQTGMTSCKQCPAGKYVSTTESDQFEDCLECPRGNKCPNRGCKDPIDCPVGTQQNNAGSALCKKCKIGTQNDETEKLKCKPCPTGTQGIIDGGNSSKHACTKCKPGTYNNDTGESSCDACPKNSFSDKQGSLSCTACKEGQYTDSESSTTCIPCAKGTSSTTYKNKTDTNTTKVKDLAFFTTLKSNPDNMDYSVIVDKSGSMHSQNWKDARAAIEQLVPVVTTQDKNGISLQFFGSTFTTYNNVTSARKVMELFDKNAPSGGTALSSVLSEALKTDTDGKSETILIITDGIPNSRTKLEKMIRNQTYSMKKKNTMLISFVQVGKDSTATTWLKGLSAKLTADRAKFDIVDTVTTDEQKGLTLEKQIEFELKK